MLLCVLVAEVHGSSRACHCSTPHAPHRHPCCRVKDIVVFHEVGLDSNLPQTNPIAKLFQQMMRSFDEQVSAALLLCAFTCSVQYSIERWP